MAEEKKHFIQSMQYDAATSAMLLTFASGSTYRYKNVPEEVFKEFSNADSKGKFFGASIRNVYASERVDPADPE